MLAAVVAVVAMTAVAIPAHAQTTTVPTATKAPSAKSKLPVVVRTIGGGVVEVTDVSRIVVLNGDVNEVLYALGLGDNIVANDITGYYPPESANKPKIGYGRTLSAEGIISQRPTLVIGTEDAGPPTAIAQLRSANVPVVIVPSGTEVADAGKKIRLIANAVGLTAAGDQLATKTEAGIRAVQKRWLSSTKRYQSRAVFLYLRGPRTLLLGGSGTRANAMLSAAGAMDAGAFFANVDGYVPITSEALVTARPDVIVVLTEGLKSVGGIDGVLKIPGVALTPAGQNKRIIDLDDLLMLELGPRTPEALNLLITELYAK
jgi:iron complex transport system substrate-binding protein